MIQMLLSFPEAKSNHTFWPKIIRNYISRPVDQINNITMNDSYFQIIKLYLHQVELFI